MIGAYTADIHFMIGRITSVRCAVGLCDKMTLKIGIGLSFYQDFHSLRRMLQSLQSYPIDLLIAVDGRYNEHPADLPFSSIECRDLIDSFQTPSGVYAIHLRTEIEKRQLYFEVAGHHHIDVLIVMDSDEYIIHNKTKWHLFIEELEHKIEQNEGTFRRCYCIPVLLKSKGQTKEMPKGYIEKLPRIFYKPQDLQYVDDHYTVRNKKTGVNVISHFTQDSVIKHLTIGHDHNLRDKEYLEQRTTYQQTLINTENELRKQRQDDFIREIKSAAGNQT
jgi:hypothetical protein